MVNANYKPENAVDGNYGCSTCSDPNWYPYASKPTKYPWFQVQLKEESFVYRVKIYNRKRCCGNRLRNVEIRVGLSALHEYRQERITINTVCFVYGGPGTDGSIVDMTCAQPIYGKYITIQRMDEGNLNLDLEEVEVYGAGNCISC